MLHVKKFLPWQMPNLVQCYEDGTQGVVLPQVNCFDYVKIYLYVEVY